MHTICPAYEGSVRTSWEPVIAVMEKASLSPTGSASRGSPTSALPSSSTRAAKLFLSGNDHRLVDAIVFGHENLDPLCVGGRDILSDVVRPDRQLAVSAVDEDRQLDGLGAAEVHQRVHRRAGRPAVMDHVVDEDHDLAVDGRHLGDRTMRRFTQVAVVAVRGHVQPAHRDGALFELGQDRGEATREDVSLADDADQDDAVGTSISLHDLVRDARERAADLVGIHHGRLEPPLSDAHANSRSRSAMRTCSPLRACRKYAARGSASTSGAISSTRGSGCITIAYLRISSSDLLSIR